MAPRRARSWGSLPDRARNRHDVAVLDRFKTGPGATVLGALLLILGGVLVVEHNNLAGTFVAFLGCVVVLKERARQRKTPPPDD